MACEEPLSIVVVGGSLLPLLDPIQVPTATRPPAVLVLVTDTTLYRTTAGVVIGVHRVCPMCCLRASVNSSLCWFTSGRSILFNTTTCFKGHHSSTRAHTKTRRQYSPRRTPAHRVCLSVLLTIDLYTQKKAVLSPATGCGPEG